VPPTLRRPSHSREPLVFTRIGENNGPTKEVAPPLRRRATMTNRERTRALSLFLANIHGITDAALQQYAQKDTTADPSIADELARRARTELTRRAKIVR
jgi:hypothetical protein